MNPRIPTSIGLALLCSVAAGCETESSEPRDFDATTATAMVGDAGAPIGMLGIDAGTPRGRTYYWADWTDVTQAGVDSGVRGLIALPSGQLAVTFSGELYGAQVDGGFQSWQPDTPYVSAAVADGPPGTDVLELAGGDSSPQVLTFSQPVLNPVLAFASLGSENVTATCIFDSPFEVLSFGMGQWGGAPLVQSPGNQLSGRESNGVIMFRGSYTAIRWTEPMGEVFDGLTVGVADPNDAWDGGAP